MKVLEERVDLVQQINNKSINDIDFVTFYPSKDNKNFYEALILCSNIDKEKFLVYFPEINMEITIDSVEKYIKNYNFYKMTDERLELSAFIEKSGKSNKVFFTIISLNSIYPKKMTKEQIEEKLGYKIEIIE